MSDSQIFEKNLVQFSKICPKTALFLPYVESNEWQFCLTLDGELNLKKGDLTLHSPMGALAEAEVFLSPLLKGKAEVIYIYGIGLGYAYFITKEWLKKNANRRIVFLEDDPEILSIFLTTERAFELLHHPQVRLIAPKEGGEVLIECCNKVFVVTALPSYLQYQKEKFKKWNQWLRMKLFLYHNCLQEEVDQDLVATNFYNKIISIAETKSYASFFESFADIPCIIVGAGPSLENDLPKLKCLEDRALLFAAGSAMNVLPEEGIFPHFGAGLDPSLSQASRIKTNSAFEIPYFFTNRFSYEAFEHLHGPKIYTSETPEKGFCEWFENQLGILHSHRVHTGFSTANFCTSLALFLGCNPIIFLGIDMCYSEGKKYHFGVKEHPDATSEVLASFKKKDALKVFNFEGKEFDTNIVFVHESSWFTVIADKNANTTFVYGSKQGFGINHVARKTLQEIEPILTRQYDLHNQAYAALETSSYTCNKNKVDAVLKVWKKSLKRCLKAISKMIKIRNVHSAESILLEMELEEEVAFQNLLKRVGEAAELLGMDLILQSRFQEQVNADFRIYERMLQVGKLHLQAMKDLPNKMQKPKEILEVKIEGEYWLKDGVLRINDPELQIDIMDVFEGKEHLQHFPDGRLKARQYYLNECLHGPSTFFSRDGKTLAQSWFYNGLREGKTLHYFLSGQLQAIERWRSGKRQGTQEYYYANGSLKSHLEFCDGLLDGQVKLYFPNGDLKFSSSFLKGKKNEKYDNI